ncbi:MAG: two pore domain potassium channel family protein [Cytophagales bacterium]|nr:two pore domain potassium channel family protein [Cytophagales bacterium]
MKALILILILIGLLFIDSLFAQGKKEMDLADILDEWVLNDDYNLTFENIRIIEDRARAITGITRDGQQASVCLAQEYLKQTHREKLKYDDEGYIEINKSISFKNSESEDQELSEFFLKGIAIDTLKVLASNLNILRMENVKINYLFMDGFVARDRAGISTGMALRQINISQCFFKGGVKILSFEVVMAWIKDSYFGDNITIMIGSKHGLSFSGNRDYILKDRVINLSDFPKKNLQWASEQVVPKDYKMIRMYSSVDEWYGIKENFFPNHEVFIGAKTNNFYLDDNLFGHITLLIEFNSIVSTGNHLIYGFTPKFQLAEKVIDIEWPQIKDRFSIKIDSFYVHPAHEKIISDWAYYKKVSRFLYSLSNNYKQAGLIQYANECLVLFKNIELERLKFIFKSEGGFEHYFRWKLAQLLKIYVDHGTNPAKAITVSMYVIFIFAIFYFFFPSEWDVTSKSRLIKDFKDFTRKNNKGYFRPFLSMLLGFIISLINALTLSLNSFTTLGFGRIPTKGLARYVCIIQGFIGWFLLTIFTVSLINQVLA